MNKMSCTRETVAGWGRGRGGDSCSSSRSSPVCDLTSFFNSAAGGGRGVGSRTVEADNPPLQIPQIPPPSLAKKNQFDSSSYPASRPHRSTTDCRATDSIWLKRLAVAPQRAGDGAKRHVFQGRLLKRHFLFFFLFFPTYNPIFTALTPSGERSESLLATPWNSCVRSDGEDDSPAANSSAIHRPPANV